MGQHFDWRLSQLLRTLVIVAFGTCLGSCGNPTTVEPASDLDSQDHSVSTPNVQSQSKTVPRNQALADLLRREGAQLLSNWPTDREIQMVEGDAALELNSLLADVSYTAGFLFENNKQRLASVAIGLAADAGRSDATAGNPAAPKSSFAARLETADARERQDLIDDSEMSAESLRVFEKQLAKQPISSADDELQQALMQRLDIADDVGAKLVVLNALQSPNNRVVEMALDSIDTWSDRSVVPWLKAAQNHSDSALAERISQAIEDLDQITSHPSGPGIRDVDVGALLDQTRRQREALQQKRQRQTIGQ